MLLAGSSQEQVWNQGYDPSWAPAFKPADFRSYQFQDQTGENLARGNPTITATGAFLLCSKGVGRNRCGRQDQEGYGTELAVLDPHSGSSLPGYQIRFERMTAEGGSPLSGPFRGDFYGGFCLLRLISS